MYLPQATYRVLTFGCLCIGLSVGIASPTLASPRGGAEALSGYEFSIETSNGAICRYSENEQPVLGVATGAGSSDDPYIEISVAFPLMRGGEKENRCQELARQEEERGLMDKVVAFNDMGLLSEAELRYWKDQLLSIPDDVVLEEDFTFEEDFDDIEEPVSCIGECL